MGRNDLCFCGSGKKSKNCHDNINSESVAGRLAKANTQIDTCIQNHYNNQDIKPPCCPGCIDCCYDYFEISSAEYALILVELSTWDKKEIDDLIFRVKKSTDSFKHNQVDMFEELERRKNKSTDNKKRLSMPRNLEPCPFIHPSKKICMVYKNRPIVCRIFGSVFPNRDAKHFDNWAGCEYIGKRIDIKGWQPNVEIFDNIEELKANLDVTVQERFKVIELDQINKIIKEKGFPIFYALNMDFEQTTDIYSIVRKYRHLIELSEDEYKDFYFKYLES